MGAALSSGRSGTKVYFPEDSLSLPLKTPNGSDSKGTDERRNATLAGLVHERCSALFREFRPPWWLFNGHLQTLYCVVGDFTKVDHIVYKRTMLRLLDGGTIGLDWAPADEDSLPETTPVIVVMHGLTGGSYEAYVRAVLSQATRPKSDGGLGYRAVVCNFRGCANVPISTPQLYSAGHTDDLRTALLHISDRYPHAPLYGLGFSLGANVMVRFLAEEREKCRLKAACVLGCPWDLNANNDALENTLMGKYAYSRGMASNLLRLLSRHTIALSEPATHMVAQAMHRALALRSPSLEQFDDAFTRVAGGSAPPFPFESAKDYYTWASSHKVLHLVTKPLLALNAADDPVVQVIPTDKESPSVVMAVTRGGGHLGWFESETSAADPDLKGSKPMLRRWFTQPVLEWFRMLEEYVDTSDTPKGKIYTTEDGWLKEEGLDHLGCKVLEGEGGTVDEMREEGLLQGL